MSSDGDVTRYLRQLSEGDRDAVQPLWEKYYHRLVDMARSKLRDNKDVIDDPEDIALTAFDSFFRRAQKGLFPRLNDRHDLWQILVMIAERKVIDAIKRVNAGKRKPRQGGARIVPLDNAASEQVFSKEPTPQMAEQMAEDFNHLLRQLPEDRLQRIALLKLQGCTNNEIGQIIGLSLSMVELQLKKIRKCWEENFLSASDS